MEWHENTFVDPMELMELLRSSVKPRTIHGKLHVYHNVFHGSEVVDSLSKRFHGRKAKDVATVLMRCGYLCRVLKGGEIGAAFQSTRDKLKVPQVFHDDERMYAFSEKSRFGSVVIVRSLQAEGLVPKSVHGLCNAFVLVQGPWGILRTPTVQNTLHPVWNSTFLLIIQPGDQDRATLGFEVKDSIRMGNRTCGRCVLSIDHLRLFLASKSRLNLPKALTLELVQGSAVSFLDDTCGQETRMDCVKVTHWYSNISSKFFAKQKKTAAKLFLEVWMSSTPEPPPKLQATSLSPPTPRMRKRAMTSEETTIEPQANGSSNSNPLYRKNSLLRAKAFTSGKPLKAAPQGDSVEQTTKHAAFDTLVARSNRRSQRVVSTIERTQHKIDTALKAHGPEFVFYYPRLAFEIISHAGLSGLADETELFGDNRDVVDASQWTIVAPMIPRLCRRVFAGMVFEKLVEIHVGRAVFLESLVAHKPLRFSYEVFATYVSALESEWSTFGSWCGMYTKFSSKRSLPAMGGEEMPLVASEFVRGTVGQKASTGMLGKLWITNKAVVYKRTRFIGASSVERKTLDAAVSAQESNSTIHQGMRIGFTEAEDKGKIVARPPRFPSMNSVSSEEDVELNDVKSKRVDNYSVYRFSSVKDRNACLQVVKEIICFNRFCRTHLLPLLNKSSSSATNNNTNKDLENRVMELANELLLYSILSYRAMLVTQEESKAALRNKKPKTKRKGKTENKLGDDPAGDESDEDFDVKGVMDEDNKEAKNTYYPFFYSMTRRYQKKKVHDISRGFLDLLDAVQEERKEVSGVTASTRKSVDKVFDTLAAYLLDHAVRIEERSRYGHLPSLKNNALNGYHFDGFFLFSPDNPATTNAMHSEPLLAAVTNLWIEDLRDEVSRQVASSAKLQGLSQNVQLMRDLLDPMTELAATCVEAYEDLTNWKDPVYNLVVISAIVVFILNRAFDYSLALVPLGTTLIILHFRTLKEKGELPVLMIPPRRKRNLIERYKDTRRKYRLLKDTVYKGNLVLLKLRGLFTSEDARVTNTFLQFLVVLAILLILIPGYILQLILVAHVFTSKMAFRQPMKKKIIEFIKLVWESIPHSPLIKPDGELLRLRRTINFADLDT